MNSKIFKLPQFTAEVILPKQYNETNLVVAGGRTPDIAWLQEVAATKKLYCADKGVEVCLKAKLVPTELYGDGDSGTKEAYEKALSNRNEQYHRKTVSEKRGFDTIYVTIGDYGSGSEIDVYEDQIQALYTGIRLPIMGKVLEFFQKPLGICIIICVPVGIYFAYEIIKYLINEECAKKVLDSVYYK